MYATRDFAPLDLIVPYLGRATRKANDMRCPRSNQRGGRRRDSPYAVEHGKTTWDASCERSYASMANHAPAPQANVALVIYGLRSEDLQPEAGTDRLRHRTAGCSVPDIVRHAPDRRQAGVDMRACLWLEANRRIATGEELLCDYGKHAAHLIGLRHATEPPLC